MFECVKTLFVNLFSNDKKDSDDDSYELIDIDIEEHYFDDLTNDIYDIYDDWIDIGGEA